MASSYFKVKNGIQIGPLSIDATTGEISSTAGAVSFGGNIAVSSISKNDSSIAINDTGSSSNVDIIVDGTRAVVFTGTAMLPNTDQTYDLGSANLQWRDVYVGPGSLYVNGQKVLQEDSGNIVVSADINQNLVIQTSGSGNLELDPVGTGVVAVKGTLQIEAGTNITGSDGNAVNVAVGVKTDSVTSKTTNTDLTVSANGTGVVRVDDDMVVTGNLTISGTTTTVNTTTLSVADNLIDLNSDFTTGSPTENAGLRVLRGDESSVQIRWNETSDAWQLTNDGTTYGAIATEGYVDAAVAGKDNTDEITEGSTNLYFTQARARGSISVTGAATYNSSTGVINVTGGVTSVAGKTGAVTFTHNHATPYVVTSTDSAANASASAALTAATLGFDMTGAITYQVYINRLLARPTEVSVDTSNGTLTFSTGVLATDDEIEAVWVS
jgi:hypothetical protein